VLRDGRSKDAGWVWHTAHDASSLSLKWRNYRASLERITEPAVIIYFAK